VAVTLAGLEVRALQSDALSPVNGCELSVTDSGGVSTTDLAVVLLMTSNDSEVLDADCTVTVIHNN